MPYASKTEHSARIENPDKYVDFARKNNFFFEKSYKKRDKGIDVLFGIKEKEGKHGGKSEIQAIRFKVNRWTPDKAKEWLKDHDFKVIKFEEAKTEIEEDAGITTASAGVAAGGPGSYAPKVMPTVTRYGVEFPMTVPAKQKQWSESFLNHMKETINEAKEEMLDVKKLKNKISSYISGMESSGDFERKEINDSERGFDKIFKKIKTDKISKSKFVKMMNTFAIGDEGVLDEILAYDKNNMMNSDEY